MQRLSARKDIKIGIVKLERAQNVSVTRSNQIFFLCVYVGGHGKSRDNPRSEYCLKELCVISVYHSYEKVHVAEDIRPLDPADTFCEMLRTRYNRIGKIVRQTRKLVAVLQPQNGS